VNQLNKLMSLAEAQGYNNKIQNFVKRIKNRKNTIVRNRNKANSAWLNYVSNGKPPPLPAKPRRNNAFAQLPNSNALNVSKNNQNRYQKAINNRKNRNNNLRTRLANREMYSVANRVARKQAQNKANSIWLNYVSNGSNKATRQAFAQLPGSNAFNVNKNTQKRYINAAHRSFPFWNKRRYWVGNPLNRK
jgi:hypothetical protein